jgi:hypothetical protein
VRRVLLIPLLAFGLSLLIAACGEENGGDDEGTAVSLPELSSTLPAGGDLGPDRLKESEWSDAADLLNVGLVIPAATEPGELGTAFEDAGFQGAVTRDVEGPRRNVRISAIQFDSEEGAREARDLLHDEDLKQPCAEKCEVSPSEYDLKDVPDSAAVHHAPIERDVPQTQRTEAYHAEFVIGPRLYVAQVDGPPSSTFSTDFNTLMRTVYRSASSAE